MRGLGGLSADDREDAAMERNASHGRHGGDKGRPDNGDDQNPNKAASRDTDVESLAADRNVSRGGGKKPSDR
jgi:hypothetical protein